MTESGLPDIMGCDSSTADFDQMERADLIILVGGDVRNRHGVVGMRINRAVLGGTKLIALGESDSFIGDIADITMDMGDDLDVLRQILKAVMYKSTDAKALPGYDELFAQLEDVQVGDSARAVADKYTRAKHAVIVFEQDALTADAARLLGDMTLCAGHSHSPRSGIIQLKPGPNSQGLANLGVLPGDVLREKISSGYIKGLMVFGEDVPGSPPGQLEFLAVQEIQMTDTANEANVVLPARSYAESRGTFTNTVGKTQTLKPAVASCIELENTEIITGLISASGITTELRAADDVRRILNGLQNRSAVQPLRLSAPKGNEFGRTKTESTDALYRSLLLFAKEKNLM